MTPALMVIIADASFAAISAADTTGQIRGSVSRNGFTHYITFNLTPPGGTVFVQRMNADGSVLRTQAKQPAYTVITDTFFGWPAPS